MVAEAMKSRSDSNAQVGRKRANRRRPGFHADAQHPLHDQRGQQDIHPFAGQIDQITTGKLEDEVEHQHQQHADSQHP